MTREEIHQEIGNILSLMEINNNRMLLNEAHGDLDQDVMRGYVRKLYELLDRLSVTDEASETIAPAVETKEAEPEVVPPVEETPEPEAEAPAEPAEPEAPIVEETPKPRKRKKLKFKPEPVVEEPVEVPAEETVEPVVEAPAPEPEPVEEEEVAPPVVEKPAPPKKGKAKKAEPKVPQDDIYAKFKYAKLDSIKKGISISKRYEIQNELFGNDPQAYNEAIRVLDGAASHDAALDYMQNTLMVTHQWDEEDALVEELKTLLIRRFM